MTVFEEIGKQMGQSVADYQNAQLSHAFHSISIMEPDFDPECDVCLHPEKYKATISNYTYEDLVDLA